MQSSADGLVLGHQYLNGLNKKTEKRFKFLFNLTGKLTRAFLTVNRATYSNPGTQVESQNKDFSTG